MPIPAILGGCPAFARAVHFTRARSPSRATLLRHLDPVLESRWFTNRGAKVIELSERMRVWLGSGFCELVCNGTVGLMLALRALDVRGEVITTPFTFPATVHAIEWNGLIPVFADVDPSTYNLDPARVEEAVTERTSALLPVHVFGNPCDTETFDALAERHGLRLLYDAAHALLVEQDGRPLVARGDLSVLSLHATKLFHTAEGGAILGHDDDLRDRIRSLGNFAILDEERVSGVGINGKLSELHAAMGLALLEDTEEEIRLRAERAEIYRAGLSGIEGISFQQFPSGVKRNHSYFTIEVSRAGFGLSRDELAAALRAENVVVRKYFHPLCSENSAYRDLPSAAPANLPNARRLARRILTLPLFGELPVSAVELVVERILAIREHAPAVRRRLAGGREG